MRDGIDCEKNYFKENLRRISREMHLARTRE